MKRMTIQLLTFVLLFSGITLIACKKMENYKTKKVEYDVSPSAPNGYDALILVESYVGDAIIPWTDRKCTVC